MMKVFVDKNVLFHYMRKILFNEEVPLSSLQIMRCIHNKKLHAVISENAIFGLINYCIYKLERDYNLEQKECEKKTKDKIRYALKGNWEIRSLTLQDFQNALEENDVPFEDYCQYLCAKKEKLTLITHNIDDFTSIQDIKIRRPREFIELLVKNKVITTEEVQAFTKQNI